MSVHHGVIRDHVVILPGNAQLVDGQRVEVRILDRKRSKARAAEDAFQQRLLEIGLLSEVRPSAASQLAQGRVLAEVAGKPLSQAIIEERR